MEKFKCHTPNFTAENIQKLAALFPNCVVEAKDAQGKPTKAIDVDQLRQELSTSVVEGPRERYHLDWPGKREAMLAANAPIAKTLRPCRDESVDFDITKNLFIEGDNLDALKLLQETYLNRVKMIYIDPPYNTGKEFIYDDDFTENTEAFFQRSNQKDEQGNRMVANTEANGRFHSDWLTMLYPRLKLARNLLCEDGFIFVSIDDNEVANLRKLCDQVFGEAQFVAQIIIQSNKRGQTYKEIAKTHEYLLVYSKGDDIQLNEVEKGGEGLPFSDAQGGYDLWELRNRNPKFGRFNRENLFFPIYVAPDLKDECGYSRISLVESDQYRVKVYPRNSEGVDGCWRWGKEKGEKLAKVDLTGPLPVVIAKQRKDGEWNIYEKSRKSTTKVKSIWNDNEVISEQGTIELGDLDLADLFDHPKPIGLLQRCVHVASSDEDIVLDFFAGSATTAHAVMRLNAEDGGKRRFIMVQIADPCDVESEAFKKGYQTIAAISKERIRRAGSKVKAENATNAPNLDIGFRVLKVESSNMKEVYYAPDAVKQSDLVAHADNIKEDRAPEDLLFQVLVDWGVDLALPISRETIAGKTAYFVDGNALAACFDSSISEDLVKELAKRKPLRAVFRDNSYGSDSVKINVEQIFKLLSPTTEIKSL